METWYLAKFLSDGGREACDLIRAPPKAFDDQMVKRLPFLSMLPAWSLHSSCPEPVTACRDAQRMGPRQQCHFTIPQGQLPQCDHFHTRNSFRFSCVRQSKYKNIHCVKYSLCKNNSFLLLKQDHECIFQVNIIQPFARSDFFCTWNRISDIFHQCWVSCVHGYCL